MEPTLGKGQEILEENATQFYMALQEWEPGVDGSAVYGDHRLSDLRRRFCKSFGGNMPANMEECWRQFQNHSQYSRWVKAGKQRDEIAHWLYYEFLNGLDIPAPANFSISQGTDNDRHTFKPIPNDAPGIEPEPEPDSGESEGPAASEPDTGTRTIYPV